jgi:Tol biopolymer transport system component
MTVDQRARQAARDAGRAVSTPSAANERFGHPDSFHSYVARKRRNQRISAGAVGALVAIAALLFVIVTFRSTREQPATPPHPEGLIVFRRSAPGVEAGRFFIIDPDGSHEFALPWSVTSECPTWFPDGSRILIQGSTYPGAPLRPATIKPDGTDLTLLDAAKDPNVNLGCGDISPDGSRLALEGFNDHDHSVDGTYTVRVSDGGDLVRLTNGGGEPSYLPDGRVVFGRTEPQHPHKLANFVSNADGTGMYRLTPWRSLRFLPGGDGPANSSPDGQWIVFPQSDGTLGLIHPDGTDLHAIPIELPRGSIAAWPQWSPDGTTLVFQLESGGQADLYTVRPDGSNLVQITNTPNIDETDPDWGPAPN